MATNLWQLGAFCSAAYLAHESEKQPTTSTKYVNAQECYSKKGKGSIVVVDHRAGLTVFVHQSQVAPRPAYKHSIRNAAQSSIFGYTPRNMA